jgi:hypothetical protein
LLGVSGLPAMEVADRLQASWSAADQDFSKLFLDASVGMSFGDSFAVALLLRNALRAGIQAAGRELASPRQATVGIAFRPRADWGVYLDVDVARSELYFASRTSQPISLGLEKGFFGNQMLLRVGMRNDLAESYFLGRKSNVLYGLGIGVQLAQLAVDASLALDRDGRIRSVAVSGFIRFGKTN